jgi:hypothetical protein
MRLILVNLSKMGDNYIKNIIRTSYHIREKRSNIQRENPEDLFLLTYYLFSPLSDTMYEVLHGIY